MSPMEEYTKSTSLMMAMSAFALAVILGVSLISVEGAMWTFLGVIVGVITSGIYAFMWAEVINNRENRTHSAKDLPGISPNYRRYTHSDTPGVE